MTGYIFILSPTIDANFLLSTPAQITIALKYLPYGKEVALITDGRFSGVSTGACIGHIGPEALDGGPIGKLKENDMIEINIDTINLEGSLNLIGEK